MPSDDKMSAGEILDIVQGIVELATSNPEVQQSLDLMIYDIYEDRATRLNSLGSVAQIKEILSERSKKELFEELDIPDSYND